MAGANAIRRWAIGMARAYRDLFIRVAVPRRWLWRWLFIGANGQLSPVAEYVLADLRDFARLQPNQFDGLFHSDAQVMAYRAGKQAVVRRMFYFLNLDEAAVQELINMEVDDGL